MNRSAQKIRRELIIGVAGMYLTLFFWRLLSPLIASHLSSAALQAASIAAMYSLVLVPLAVVIGAKEKISDYGFPRQHLPKQIGIGILIGLGMGCVLSLLPMALGLKKLVYGGETYQSTGEALFRLAYFIFNIGFVEEFIFRGFVYHKLKEICLSDLTPILISSLLFGLYHFSGLNFAQVLMTGLIGAFFCVCRERISGCTLISLAIAHGIHDWLIRIFAALF